MTTWNPTHLQLTVLRARNLIKAKGSSKLTDVFVTIHLGKEKFQTSTIKNAHNPEWFEQCDLSIPEMRSDVELTVMHRGLLSDEFLGYASVPLWEHNVFERPRSQWVQLSHKPSKAPDNKYRGEVEVRLVFQVKSKADATIGSTGFRKRSPSIRSIASAVGQKVGDKLKFVRSRSFRESRTSDNSSKHGKSNTINVNNGAEAWHHNFPIDEESPIVYPPSEEDVSVSFPVVDTDNNAALWKKLSSGERSRSYSVSLDRRSMNSDGYGRDTRSMFSPGDRRSVTLPVNYSVERNYAFSPVKHSTDDNCSESYSKSPEIFISVVPSRPGYLESVFREENEVYTTMKERNSDSRREERPKRPPRRSKFGHVREVSRSSDSDTEGSEDIVLPRVLRKNNPNPAKIEQNQINTDMVTNENHVNTENPKQNFKEFINDIKQENEFRSSGKSNTVESQNVVSQSQEEIKKTQSDSVDGPQVINNLNMNGDDTHSGSGTSSRKKIAPEMDFRFGSSPRNEDNGQNVPVRRRPKRDKLRQLYTQGGRRYTVQGLDHPRQFGYSEDSVSDFSDPRFRYAQGDCIPDDLIAVYKNMTKEELIRLVITTKAKLIRKDHYIQDLEKYIDQLLVRVMEVSPRLLQQPPKRF